MHIAAVPQIPHELLMHLAPADQHLVWNGLDQASNTKKRAEGGVRRISAIEPENELIHVLKIWR